MNLQKKSKNRQKRESHSEIIKPYILVSYLSVALFVGLIAYILYFQFAKRDALLNSPLNKRQDAVEAQVIRGSILAADGEVLAETQLDEAGNPVRVYPYGSLFAHTVGYGVYGGSGLESSHNNDLIHSHISLVSQVQSELEDAKKPGDSLVTTLDVALQHTASQALEGAQGTVVVMEADTGRVLADLSRPAFDPNSVSEDWEWLTQEENGIFLNRAMQGLYPPGSTFKIVTALAYLRQYGSFDDFYYECTGTYEQDGFTIHCANDRVHGLETMSDAMANSCNCAFAAIAMEKIDPTLLQDTAVSLGFNKTMTTDLPYTESSFSLDTKRSDPLTMQTAIGQGDTLATPMLLCQIAQAVANDGKMYLPQFTDKLKSDDGSVVKTYGAKTMGQVMTAEEATALRNLLQGVVQFGTAADLSDLPYDIAGKTGTAEYGDVSEGHAHSWFVGFSQTGQKDIVVCVLVEDGVYTGTQVARQIFQSYFSF